MGTSSRILQSNEFIISALPNAVLGKQTGRLIVERVGIFPKLVPQQKRLVEDHPELFMFCDGRNGSTQFRVERDSSLDCTIETLAGTLAVHCLVRGQAPEDFTVFVPAENAFVERLRSRARKLLIEGRTHSGSVSLSARQKEILNFVVRNQANKEIASHLNISVRTVKFHISALLEKFGVTNRNELARKAAGLLAPSAHQNVPPTQAVLPNEEREEVVRAVAVGERLHVPDRRRSIRFPARKFSS